MNGAPHLVLIVVSRPDRPIDLPASLDRLEELHPLATDHQPDSVLSVKIGMGGPFAEHPVRLAAAAGAAEENLEHRARQQGRLRPRLRLPPDRVRSGGFLAIRHQCFSFAPGAYSACHSSRVAETAGARMTVGREISPECSTDERREWQNGAAAHPMWVSGPVGLAEGLDPIGVLAAGIVRDELKGAVSVEGRRTAKGQAQDGADNRDRKQHHEDAGTVRCPPTCSVWDSAITLEDRARVHVGRIDGNIAGLAGSFTSARPGWTAAESHRVTLEVSGGGLGCWPEYEWRTRHGPVVPEGTAAVRMTPGWSRHCARQCHVTDRILSIHQRRGALIRPSGEAFVGRTARRSRTTGCRREREHRALSDK